MLSRVLIFVMLFSAVGAWNALSAGSAQAQGSLLKASGPAVYFVADTGERFAFPNERIYFSWYNDFADVQTVTDEVLATFPFTGSITYRPGARLVKLITDPKVYAVEYGGVLRHVTSESVAVELYGDDWARQVDDLSDAFFPHYLVGDPVTSEADLDVPVDETDLNDPAQLNGAIRQERKVEIFPIPLSSSYLIQGADDRRVLGFSVQVNEEVDLTSLRLRLRSLTYDTLGHFADLNLTDLHGRSVLDGAELLDEDSQMVILDGLAELLPGRHPLYVTLDVDEDAPLDESYDVTAYVSAMEIDGEALGSTYENVDSERLTITSGALSVELGSGVTSQTFTPGARTVDAVKFDLTMTGLTPAVVEEIVVTGYIDEGEEDPDFLAGFDEDDGGITKLSDVVGEVKLVLDDGTVLGTIDEVQTDGRIVFSNLDLTVETGETVSVIVRTDVDTDAPTGLGADRFAFDIANPQEDIELADAEQDIEGEAPNGAGSPVVIVTIAEHGELSLTTVNVGSNLVVFGEQDSAVQSLTFEADDVEDFTVSTLTFHLLDPVAKRDIATYILHYQNAAGEAKTASESILSSSVTFENLDLFVPQDDEADVLLGVTIQSGTGGATSGDEIKLEFDPNAAFRAVGSASGEVFDDFDEDVTAESLDPAQTITVRRNRPSFSAGTVVIDDDVRTRQEDVLSVNAKADGEGTTYIQTLTLKIEPDDVGTELYDGSLNDDLLEYLAGVNGDAQDDNEIVELRDEATGTVYGEDNAGHISYKIYDASSRTIDSTPNGLQTERGDYGLIVYEFTTPLALNTVGKNLVFSLDLSGFASQGGVLKVTLLGGGDFTWHDGNATRVYTGSDALGLPKSKTVSVLP